MKSANVVWNQTQVEQSTNADAWKLLSAVLSAGQWVCVPLLSFGGALLAVTLASSLPMLHDVVRVTQLLASLVGVLLPIGMMLKARSFHRQGLYGIAMVANAILLAATVVMVSNIVADGRLF